MRDKTHKLALGDKQLLDSIRFASNQPIVGRKEDTRENNNNHSSDHSNIRVGSNVGVAKGLGRNRSEGIGGSVRIEESLGIEDNGFSEHMMTTMFMIT